MDYFELSEPQRQVLASICAEEGIETSYQHFVAQHVDVADDKWRWCCNSSCDPCVETLARAVHRARQALCIEPRI